MKQSFVFVCGVAAALIPSSSSTINTAVILPKLLLTPSILPVMNSSFGPTNEANDALEVNFYFFFSCLLGCGICLPWPVGRQYLC